MRPGVVIFRVLSDDLIDVRQFLPRVTSAFCQSAPVIPETKPRTKKSRTQLSKGGAKMRYSSTIRPLYRIFAALDPRDAAPTAVVGGTFQLSSYSCVTSRNETQLGYRHRSSLDKPRQKLTTLDSFSDCPPRCLQRRPARPPGPSLEQKYTCGRAPPRQTEDTISGSREVAHKQSEAVLRHRTNKITNDTCCDGDYNVFRDTVDVFCYTTLS